jgi:hypothetical protein
MARQQAREIAAAIQAQGGPSGLEGKKIVALVAYLQRLGTDIRATPGVPPPGGTRPVAEGKNGPPHAMLSPAPHGKEGI